MKETVDEMSHQTAVFPAKSFFLSSADAILVTTTARKFCQLLHNNILILVNPS